MSAFTWNAVGVPNSSTITEWSITSSAGRRGLPVFGSPPTVLDIDVRHEVFGLAEAASRQALVLLIGQRHPLAERRVDGRRHRVASHGEVEHLRHRAGERHHRELALPGLADPALLGKLLHVAGALALGVAPRQRGPGVEGETEQGRDDQSGDDELLLPRQSEVHPTESTVYTSVR